MSDKLPSIIVTGASGIVGRGFLEAAKEDYLIYAIARRPQKEAGVEDHPNIKWIQVDIGNWISLRWVMHNIKRQGGADYLIHLAGYYDFDYEDHPEYERTNVNGTRYVLEQAKILRVKRFIFASSTAASNFPAEGEYITEKSPLDADYQYAVSKRKCEAMVRESSNWFPCSIVRFAAVFTDWCEYGPLYMFLNTWFSRKWNSKILGGKGESAVPYIHSNDLNKLMLTILKKTRDLPDYDIYIASPDGSTSHQELFDAATRLYFGQRLKAIHFPKWLALPGVYARDILGRLIGHRPFERPWMIKYVDLKLDVDASYTREALKWRPTPRYHILRRLLYMIEKMKLDPTEWNRKNRYALKRVVLRPNLMIYEAMIRLKEEMVQDIKNTILDPARQSDFKNYQLMKAEDLDWNINIIYQLISASVRNRDRMLLLNYELDLAQIRFKEGFTLREVCIALLEVGKVIIKKLMDEPELQKIKQLIHDCITLTLQLTVDEIEAAHEKWYTENNLDNVPAQQDIEEKLKELETFYTQP